MASAKFNKGSEEWMMFTDFWNLCQKYWITEDTDEYWKEVLISSNEFYEKYKSIPLCGNLVIAFLDSQDEKSRR